jgi:LacI family transcriptional regulator
MVLGLNEGIRGRVNPANWAIRMMIYQGIAEAGFMLNTPVKTLDIMERKNDITWMKEYLKDVDGLLIHGDFLRPETHMQLINENIATVTINSPESAEYCSGVDVDTKNGAFTAAEHLIKQGRKRIGFISGLQSTLPMRLRFEGLKQALKHYNIPLRKELLIFNTDGFPRDGAEAAEKLLNAPEPPNAIFAATDFRAIGVIQKLNELNVRIPEEVAVIGFDNIPEAALQTPALTTINNPLYECGFEALKMLYRKISAKDSEITRKQLKMQLIIRESC